MVIIAATIITIKQIMSLSVYICLAKYRKCFLALNYHRFTYLRLSEYLSCYHKLNQAGLFDGQAMY